MPLSMAVITAEIALVRTSFPALFCTAFVSFVFAAFAGSLVGIVTSCVENRLEDGV